MEFEWDLVKAVANMRKHAVSFEEATSIFRGAWTHRHDLRRDYGETRLIALGRDSNGIVLSRLLKNRRNREQIFDLIPVCSSHDSGLFTVEWTFSAAC